MSDILLSRYKIIRSLASGGFGDTYLAQDVALPGNPLCVVKHLKPKMLSSQALPIAKTLFEREAEYLYQLGEHSQIPRLYAHFQEEGEFYLVQEFVDGNELSEELILGEPWNESKTVQLLQEILEVLAVVHQKNVIHRDIKPSNIMRRKQDKKLILIDFGAVKEFSSLTVTTGGQTSLTVAIGTPGYMPPEQAHGKPTLASDVYAVGMIAIQALTGVYPHQLPTDPKTGEIIWSNHATVSAQLATILNQMIHEYHRLRYQNASEALQALNSLNSINTTPHTNPITSANTTISTNPITSANPTVIVSAAAESNSNSQTRLTANKILPWILGGMGGLVLAGIGGIIINRFTSNPPPVATVSPTPSIASFPIPDPSPLDSSEIIMPSPSDSPEIIMPSPSISSPSSSRIATWLSESGRTRIAQLDTICWGNSQINAVQTVFNNLPYQGNLNFSYPITNGCMPGDVLTGTFELSSNGNYCTGEITVTWYEGNKANIKWLITNLGANCPVDTEQWQIDTFPVKG